MAEYANIIVDIFNEKLDKTFQYRIPEAMKEKLTLGMQVYVPFGKRNIKGYVVELTDEEKKQCSGTQKRPPEADGDRSQK